VCDDDPFKSVIDILAQTQGTSMAVYDILLEVVMRIASAQPDPSAFLKSMYEAISAKLDQTPLETEKKAASGHEREALSTFFSVAEKAVRRRTQGQGGKGPQQD
jgi:hypothetical protein